ncbi:hypothetical protein [Microbispora siamensis]|uniref:Uncharacterized protein n=1 Tax=Microbispora siamensis TaxID=564413 RepID=A0ABQ4GF18_9ACTN|nr:hypothetical protein [Microbispora siamensis]GIH60019.1 hypothetical protein Msi02_08360 [Microbispora siamensis]
MPDFSPTPRHRRDGHPVLALTGVIGVTAIAGLGVVLAVLPARDPVPSAARPVAADLGAPAAPARPAPGFPAAGPFFSPATAPRQPASERPASRRGALPPGHEAEASRLPGRHARTANPSTRSRPPSPVSSARRGGSDSSGATGLAGTREAHRPRPTRIASPGTPKPAARGPATGDSAAGSTAARNAAKTAKDAASKDAAPKDTAARDSGTRSTAVPPTGVDGAARTRIQDPCLRFDDDLRRAYCYEVLRRLAQ